MWQNCIIYFLQHGNTFIQCFICIKCAYWFTYVYGLLVQHIGTLCVRWLPFPLSQFLSYGFILTVSVLCPRVPLPQMFNRHQGVSCGLHTSVNYEINWTVMVSLAMTMKYFCSVKNAKFIYYSWWPLMFLHIFASAVFELYSHIA